MRYFLPLSINIPSYIIYLRKKITSIPHDSLISEIGIPCFLDAVVHNDVKKGQEVPKTASEGVNHADQTKSVYDDNATEFLEQPLNESISEKIRNF